VTKEQVSEFQALISEAIERSREAAMAGDIKTAQHFAAEATDLLEYLHSPEAKVLQ
jgi:hypothetical protein